MRIILSTKGPDAPFGPPTRRRRAARAYSGDYYGAFSLEKFASAGSLQYTHEDAQGWMAYLGKFYPNNFWYKDANVKPWAYYEEYDNWQDTYGMDAVLAVYHSGHGGMGADGTFTAPLGAAWGNLGTSASSSKMSLGNEQANYVFWSTCLSLRVLGGHNPIRTWSPANKGFRMLFGYETTSWDDPDYGKYFWQEWCKGKSLGTAFLDASWRIAHDQAPAVVACGATADEAKTRVFHERIMEWAHARTDWWWWRWYYAQGRSRRLSRELPTKALVAELKPPTMDDTTVRNVIRRFGLRWPMPDSVVATPDGVFYLRHKKQRLSFAGDGSYEVELAAPNSRNRVPLTRDAALKVAEQAVRRYGLNDGVTLVADGTRQACEAGSALKTLDRVEGPFVTETLVDYRQVINGLPVLTPGIGTITIGVDNDGAVTRILVSIREVERLTDRVKNTTSTPGESAPRGALRAATPAGYEALLDEVWRARMEDRYPAIRGTCPTWEPVPESTEVGYEVQGHQAFLAARRTVELDFGADIRKRYPVVAPLLE
jgi:hypothetical protein